PSPGLLPELPGGASSGGAGRCQLARPVAAARWQGGTEMSTESEPRYIQVHPQDNVAIIVNPGGLLAGTQFPSGLVLQEAVPEAHKVALLALQPGDAVIR